MKIIGLTGGIGSGKSTVLQLFQDLGAQIFIADVDQLPNDPNTVINLFRKARKSPVFLIINRLNSIDKIRSYLDSGVDDLLTMPIDADKLYRKVKRAAEYNRMQHEIEYHSGMVFILKMLIPVLMTIVFIITNRG